MSNFFEKLFVDYNYISNNKIALPEKIEHIKRELSLKDDIPLMFLGVLNDFISNEPQYYYSKEVEKEVFTNLTTLYTKDSDKFRNSFFKYQHKFFHSINSYYHILDLLNEFDDVDFDSRTKTKIYYLPIITQLLEFCLNHFYRGLASIIGDLKDKDYTQQNTLGKLKNVLSKEYQSLMNVDIDFRDAISHGTVEVNSDSIVYSYIEKGSRNLTFKELKFYKLNDIKNELIDISSGAIVGLLRFFVEHSIFNQQYVEKADENINFELLKLFLHNENVQVQSFSKGFVGTPQLNIKLDIKGIDDTSQIIHLLILVGKIIYATFNDYDRYLIGYTHPFSMDGFISLEKNKLAKILFEDSIHEIDEVISEDLGILIPDIQKNVADNRSYKFHTFPKVSGINWEVSHLKDISIDNIKRFEARLIINDEDMSKQDIEKLLFQVTKKIRVLENKSNPITKIKHGKIEADVVRLLVFFKTRQRNSFSLFSNNKSFICLAHYYKSKSVVQIQIPFQENYTFEKMKKIDVYWNRNFDVFKDNSA